MSAYGLAILLAAPWQPQPCRGDGYTRERFLGLTVQPGATVRFGSHQAECSGVILKTETGAGGRILGTLLVPDEDLDAAQAALRRSWKGSIEYEYDPDRASIEDQTLTVRRAIVTGVAFGLDHPARSDTRMITRLSDWYARAPKPQPLASRATPRPAPPPASERMLTRTMGHVVAIR